MLRHYLKISFRSIWKDKVYSLINIIGLTIAIACCFLFIFWIRYELSFEKDHVNADRIYVVLEAEIRSDQIKKHIKLQPPVFRELKADYPFVEEVTCVSIERLHYSTENKNRLMLSIAFSYPELLTIFPLKCVAGTMEGIKQNKKGRLISEAAAINYFGSAINAVGKTFYSEFDNITIEGVVALPLNSHLQFDLLIIDETNAILDYSGGVHYMLVKKNYKLANSDNYLSEKKQAEISKSLSKIQNTRYTYLFQPLKDVHLYSDSTTEHIPHSSYYGDYKQVRLFGIITLLILLLAIINYVNTSTARALNRNKEVGVRKITGSSKGLLIIRFLLESLLISVVAVILALDLAKLLLPSFYNVMGNLFPFRLDWGTIGIASLVCIFTSLLSGGYAAFYMSSFNTITALKGGSRTGSKENLRKILLGVQFILCIGILTSTCIIFRQLDYILHKDLGFDRENVYEIETSLWYESEGFQQELCKNPYIIDASMAAAPPFNVEWGYSGVSWSGSNIADQEMTFGMLSCDYRFASVFGFELIEGEFIHPGYTWWQWADDKSYSIVVNETFARLLNVDNPVGLTITYFPYGSEHSMDGKIIGIIKDFHFKPLQEGIYPLIINFNPELTDKMYIKIRPENKAETLAYIEEIYYQFRTGTIGENIPFNIQPLERTYEQLYQKEVRLERLLILFSILSVFLSFMGIFGMISFMLQKRTKEIALRKINGARIKDILFVFGKEFAYLILLASFIALPIVWILMSQWIQQYVYRTSLGWWLFFVIPLCVLLLTFATIIIQVLNAARKNPIDALRNE